MGETADDRIAAECERIFGRAGHKSPWRNSPAVFSGSAALARAMGLASDAAPRPPRPFWVALRLRRVAGGRAPRAELSAFGLCSRAAHTLLLLPGFEPHEVLARRCLAALEPLRCRADPAATAASLPAATASQGEAPSHATGAASSLREQQGAPIVGPHELSLERLALSQVLVLTRDLALAERCAALGALCSRSLLADLSADPVLAARRRPVECRVVDYQLTSSLRT